MSILEQAEQHVSQIFEKEIPSGFEYHDIEHTREVVHYSKVIGRGEGLSEEGLETLLLAAWFHDSGFARDTSDHENHSAALARGFLSGKISENRIKQIEEGILATRVPQSPTNKIGEILCDADMFHLSLGEEFIIRNTKLRNEWNNIYKKEPDDRTFWDQTAYFMSIHQYFTNYAKANMQPGKEFNQRQVQREIEKLEEKQREKEKGRARKSRS